MNIVRGKYYRLLWPLAGIVFLVLVQGCSEPDLKTKDSTSEEGLGVSVTEPISRDFSEIKKSGVIRMITRYNSNTYFLQHGIERGFEYELVKEFAKKHDLSLEVVIIERNDNPYDMLNRGDGDLIAANYTITPEREAYVDFTHPYNLVDQVVVFSDQVDQPPQTLEELERRNITINVRRNSSYFHRLMEMKRQGHDLRVNIVSDDKDTETLLYEVMQGNYEATVADDNIFKAASKYMGGLIRGPQIARNDTVAWAVRKNSDGLEKQMNEFLTKHFKLRGADEPPKRSAFLNILRRRYFETGKHIKEYFNPNNQFTSAGILSPYDQVIKKVADSTDMDWKILTAIIAQESKFNPNSKSWAGAVGLMQILPRFSEVKEVSRLYDPEVNLYEGVRILKEHLRHYSYMDTTDRWKFTLAAYNAGQGHVADARRLAIDQNRDPNEWENVADALLKLMQRRYYKDARYGFCRGIETVNYVREIYNRYETYKTIMALAENRKQSGEDRFIKGVMGEMQLIN